MLAKLTREMPPAGESVYEPKWDGFRCVVFRDGDDLDLQIRNQKPLLRYFPELREPLLAQLPDRVVLDGELVVANERGLDFDALQLRQHPGRVAREEARGRDPRVVRRVRPPRARRRVAARRAVRASGARRSSSCSRRREPPLYVTPDDREPRRRRRWFSRFEGAGFDGVVAKPLADTYHPGKRAMLKVKHERTCDCVVAGYRVHKDGNGVGSLQRRR